MARRIIPAIATALLLAVIGLLGWSGALIGIAAIGGFAALVENDPGGLFATISAFSWLAYFLWIAAASIGLIRERYVPAKT